MAAQAINNQQNQQPPQQQQQNQPQRWVRYIQNNTGLTLMNNDDNPSIAAPVNTDEEVAVGSIAAKRRRLNDGRLVIFIPSDRVGELQSQPPRNQQNREEQKQEEQKQAPRAMNNGSDMPSPNALGTPDINDLLIPDDPALHRIPKIKEPEKVVCPSWVKQLIDGITDANKTKSKEAANSSLALKLLQKYASNHYPFKRTIISTGAAIGKSNNSPSKLLQSIESSLHLISEASIATCIQRARFIHANLTAQLGKTPDNDSKVLATKILHQFNDTIAAIDDLINLPALARWPAVRFAISECGYEAGLPSKLQHGALSYQMNPITDAEFGIRIYCKKFPRCSHAACRRRAAQSKNFKRRRHYNGQKFQQSFAAPNPNSNNNNSNNNNNSGGHQAKGPAFKKAKH